MTSRHLAATITGVPRVAFGLYELDTETRELWRDGRLIRVAPQAIQVLCTLTAAPGQLVTRDQLRRALWSDDTHVDFERGLNSAMRKLRTALREDADAPRYVQTLPGRGYRFIAPVRLLSRALAEPAIEDQPRTPIWRCAAATCVIALVLWRMVDPYPAVRSVAPDRHEQIWATNHGALAAYREAQAVVGDRVSVLTRSIESLETAVRLDPQFAPAWASLARARATRAMLDGRDDAELRLARIEAQRALEADSHLADAHLAEGQVRLALDNDPAAARVEFRTAAALRGPAAGDHVWVLWALHAQGRYSEALRVVDDALRREPRNATLHGWRGCVLHALRRYDDEIVELERAVSIDEASWQAALHLGLGYSRRRQYGPALAELKRAVELSDAGGLSLSWLGRIAADAGDVATAEWALDRLRTIEQTRRLAPSLAASIEYHLAAQGHKPRARQGA